MFTIHQSTTRALAALCLAIAVTGCPRDHHPQTDAGSDDDNGGKGGSRSEPSAGAGGASNGGGSGKSCGSRGQAPCGDGEFCSFPASANCGATDAPGVCAKKPEVCDALFTGVCGCDGKTYGTDCQANGAGISVAHKGECDAAVDAGTPAAKSCGGLLGAKCDDGQFCKFEPDAMCGAADATGVCAKPQTVCTKELHEVCGCDGKTYANPCIAGSMSASIVKDGPCDAPDEDAGTEPPPSGGKACGARLGNTCASGEYCSFTEQAICGDADATGTCAPIKTGCTKDYKPVCGCDGETYSNACVAASKGAAVRAQGACPGSSGDDYCGGLQGKQCGDGSYCFYTPDALCGAADQTGTCKKAPASCTKDQKPLCGCDGKTYASACEAATLKVSITKEGACEKPAAESCGGFVGKVCTQATEFCNFPLTTQCGNGDQTGTCEAPPEVCTDLYEPVCGCDSKTYSNSCHAAVAKTSVLSTGACK